MLEKEIFEKLKDAEKSEDPKEYAEAVFSLFITVVSAHLVGTNHSLNLITDQADKQGHELLMRLNSFQGFIDTYKSTANLIQMLEHARLKSMKSIEKDIEKDLAEKQSKADRVHDRMGILTRRFARSAYGMAESTDAGQFLNKTQAFIDMIEEELPQIKEILNETKEPAALRILENFEPPKTFN